MTRPRPQRPPYQYKSLERELFEAAITFIAIAAVVVGVAAWWLR